MCKNTFQSVEELEDLFKNDELNNLNLVDESIIYKYLNTLNGLVIKHLDNETETTNPRVVVNKLKIKFPNYLQKCTNKYKIRKRDSGE